MFKINGKQQNKYSLVYKTRDQMKALADSGKRRTMKKCINCLKNYFAKAMQPIPDISFGMSLLSAPV